MSSLTIPIGSTRNAGTTPMKSPRGLDPRQRSNSSNRLNNGNAMNASGSGSFNAVSLSSPNRPTRVSSFHHGVGASASSTTTTPYLTDKEALATKDALIATQRSELEELKAQLAAEQLARETKEEAFKKQEEDLQGKLKEAREQYNRMLGKQLLVQRQRAAEERQMADTNRRESHYNIALSKEEDAALKSINLAGGGSNNATAREASPVFAPNTSSAASPTGGAPSGSTFGSPLLGNNNANTNNPASPNGLNNTLSNAASAAANSNREQIEIRRLKRDLGQKMTALSKANETIVELEAKQLALKSDVEKFRKEIRMATIEKEDLQHEVEVLTSECNIRVGTAELEKAELSARILSFENIELDFRHQIAHLKNEAKMLKSKIKLQSDAEEQQGTVRDQLLAVSIAKAQAEDQIERFRRAANDSAEVVAEQIEEVRMLRIELEKYRAACTKAGILIQPVNVPTTDLTKMFSERRGSAAYNAATVAQIQQLVMGTAGGGGGASVAGLQSRGSFLSVNGSDQHNTVTPMIRSRSNSALPIHKETNATGAGTTAVVDTSKDNNSAPDTPHQAHMTGHNMSTAFLSTTAAFNNNSSISTANHNGHHHDPLANWQVSLADPSKHYACVETTAAKKLFALEKESLLTMLAEGISTFEQLFNTHRVMLGNTANIVDRAVNAMHAELGGISASGGSLVYTNGGVASPVSPSAGGSFLTTVGSPRGHSPNRATTYHQTASTAGTTRRSATPTSNANNNTTVYTNISTTLVQTPKTISIGAPTNGTSTAAGRRSASPSATTYDRSKSPNTTMTSVSANGGITPIPSRTPTRTTTTGQSLAYSVGRSMGAPRIAPPPAKVPASVAAKRPTTPKRVGSTLGSMVAASPLSATGKSTSSSSTDQPPTYEAVVNTNTNAVTESGDTNTTATATTNGMLSPQKFGHSASSATQPHNSPPPAGAARAAAAGGGATAITGNGMYTPVAAGLSSPTGGNTTRVDPRITSHTLTVNLTPVSTTVTGPNNNGPAYVASWYNSVGKDVVRSWLSLVNVFSPALENALHNAGFTDMISLAHITENDLVKMSVTPGVRRKLLAAVAELQRKMAIIRTSSEAAIKKTFGVYAELPPPTGTTTNAANGEDKNPTTTATTDEKDIVFDIPALTIRGGADDSVVGGIVINLNQSMTNEESRQKREEQIRRDLAQRLLLFHRGGANAAIADPNASMDALYGIIQTWFNDLRVAVEAQSDCVERILEQTALNVAE